MPKMLLTGGTGLLGHYLVPMSREHGFRLTTLGRSETSDIQCDLSQKTPHFTEDFDLVVHAAGSQTDADAMAVNLEGTRHLLDGLKQVKVRRFVFISSWEVYGKTEGRGITEEDHLWTSTKVGQSKALAEEEVRKFCDESGVILTVLRPVTIFGKGMRGWGQRMASQVLTGTYINIREADADLSLVTARDVARLVFRLSPYGGTFNVTDGRVHSLRDLAMAMGNNRGKAKKPFWLPMKWAKILANLGDRLPLVDLILDNAELTRRTTTLTFSSKKLEEAVPEFRFHDTVAVVGRTDKDFPYEDD